MTFLQIFLGVLRWREISAECGAPLETTQAMRFNLIGTFFNQTLPSSIGGDAVRLWLVARAGAGWRAATYSIFVDRAIGLIALAVDHRREPAMEPTPDHRSARTARRCCWSISPRWRPASDFWFSARCRGRG